MVNTPNKIAPLSRLEGLIMGVLWERGDSTAKEVREYLEETKPMAHTTVLTILSRLQEKGYIKQIPSLGRSLLFRPIVSKEKVARTSVLELLARFFGGSPEKLVAHLVEEADITTKELDTIRRKLDETK
ncbi:MAG: Transcriptional regulator BlaI [bacterium]|nr:Transcriptional regulator BlaI [bacterium]